MNMEDKKDGGKKDKKEKKGRKWAIALFWLVLWFCLARAVDNGILLATPLETAGKALALMKEPEFYVCVGMSFLRIAAGFLAGLSAGLCLAVASFRFSWLEAVLAGPMRLIKAVPVVSFVILFLVWWGSSFLAVAICFLVVLPAVYVNSLEGLRNADPGLLEMARVFRIPAGSRFFYIYRPALRPFFVGALNISLGMCWKSGIAAEVIGIPAHSIGERLYLSKVYLDTAGIFAWTAVVILFSVLFERLVLHLAELFFRWEPACKKPPGSAAGRFPITAVSLEKAYQGRKILEDYSVTYAPGQIYYLTSPSGSGKTTLLHILAGLVPPDGGSLDIPRACSMVFQEDRLCEDYSAVKNVELVLGDARRAKAALCVLLEESDLCKPCRQLSGGMRRRVALVRAMEADSAYVLLDEPFTGMDEETGRRAWDYIRRKQEARPIVIATHIFSEIFSENLRN